MRLRVSVLLAQPEAWVVVKQAAAPNPPTTRVAQPLAPHAGFPSTRGSAQDEHEPPLAAGDVILPTPAERTAENTA